MITDRAGNSYPDAISAIRAELSYRDHATQQWPELKRINDAALCEELRHILAQVQPIPTRNAA